MMPKTGIVFIAAFYTQSGEHPRFLDAFDRREDAEMYCLGYENERRHRRPGSSTPAKTFSQVSTRFELRTVEVKGQPGIFTYTGP